MPYLGFEADLPRSDPMCAPCPRPQRWEALEEQRLPPIAVLGGTEVEVGGV